MGKHLNKVTGGLGEKLAVKYLKKNKYKILETNYKNKIGEIDIIAKKDEVIVFVEVKTRTSLVFGLPREAVTNYKQNKIRLVATEYLKTNKSLNSKVSLDVIEVFEGKITHIKNAF